MKFNGRSLLVDRVRLGVKQQELAARMGVHRNTVMRYEDMGEVPEDKAKQYLAALATFRQPIVEAEIPA